MQADCIPESGSSRRFFYRRVHVSGIREDLDFRDCLFLFCIEDSTSV
uniref:Uncharacterized protein n=1 Tax=Faecalibaculum rodentium TaxID=1702221 RepID=A0A140DTR9_9FIRM|nr:hypothetical protein AALO17_09120 [Faecalibaculum rodentium]